MDALAAGDLEYRLVLVRQGVPLVLVDQQMAHRHLLVPAREVVVLGDLVEAVLDVHGGHRELGGVDHALFQRREDVAARQQLGRHAELLHDTGAEAEEAHLHAAELLQILDLFLEPARGLRPDGEAVDLLDAVFGIDFLLQVVATAEIHPGEVFAYRWAERHGGEERQRRVFADIVARGGPGGLDRALGDGVEALVRRNQGARLEEFHRELAAGKALDVLRKAHAGGAQMRQAAAPGAVHLPLDALLRIGGRGDADQADRQGGDGGHAQKSLSMHPRCLPFFCRSSNRDFPGWLLPVVVNASITVTGPRVQECGRTSERDSGVGPRGWSRHARGRGSPGARRYSLARVQSLRLRLAIIGPVSARYCFM